MACGVSYPWNTSRVAYSISLPPVSENVPGVLASRIQSCEHGHASIQAVEFDASEPTRYIIQTVTHTTILHANLPADMLHAFAAEVWTGVGCAAIGHNGTWAMVAANGKLWSTINDKNVHNLLTDGRKVRVRIELVCFASIPSDK